MNTISRTISGVVAFAIGLFVITAVVTDASEGLGLWSIVWGMGSGVLFCGVGVYLFFNKKEDDIDEIKDT